MRRLLRLLCVAGLLLCLVVAVLAVRGLRADAAVEQRGSVTEGLVTEVRGGLLRDRVVVSLDRLDGRPVEVARVGPVEVGQRLVVEFDPDGAIERGRVAGSTQDRDDARLLLLGSAVTAVVLAAVTPWRSRRRGRTERVVEG